jgi:hypothetical protein
VSMAIGPCWACGWSFAFDPDLVPSIVVEGVRRQICRNCVARANELRRHNGNPLIEVLPGAYVDLED